MVERRIPEREVGGFETYLRRVVSLSKTLYSPNVLVIPRKQWLCSDMIEKLLNVRDVKPQHKQTSASKVSRQGYKLTNVNTVSTSCTVSHMSRAV